MKDQCIMINPNIVWYEGHSKRTEALRDRHTTRLKKQIELVKHPQTKFEVFDYDVGIPAFDSCYMHVWTRKVLSEAVKAEGKGFNAIVMGCFGDPGVRECRQLVDIPVIGVGEACMHVACMLGHKFSILTPTRGDLVLIEDNARLYGVFSKIASLRALNVKYPQLHDLKAVKKRVITEARKAQEDGAEVIVLGCTMLLGIASEVHKVIDIPVVDPVSTAFKIAETFFALKKINLGHKARYSATNAPGTFSQTL